VRETVFGRSQRFSYLSNKTLFSAEQILSRARLVQGKYRVGKTSTDLFLLGRILAQEKLAGSIAKKKRKQQALGFRLLALGFAHYIRDGWGIVFVEPDGWPQSLKPDARGLTPEKMRSRPATWTAFARGCSVLPGSPRKGDEATFAGRIPEGTLSS
jgi:hypothetical protein